jgi:dethiobiotin synthetase
MFKSSALPVIGAEIERIKIKQENIIRDYEILDKQTDALLVEASGGLMTPITDDFFNIQIPLKLKLPVLFVISPTQNTINNYLNELNTAKMANLDVVGVIINKYPTTSQDPNIKAFPTLIEAYTDTKILGIIRNFRGKTVQSNVLFNEILNGINFEDLFRIKIPKLNGF